MRKPLLFVTLGVLFGFLLSRAGATTYDYYATLFLFQDLQLMWVIAAAAAVGWGGVRAFRHFQIQIWGTDEPVQFRPKPMKAGLVPGALLLCVGWGLAGTCPGTALAMLGEGKLSAGCSIVGILLGTYLYGLRQDAMRCSDSASLP